MTTPNSTTEAGVTDDLDLLVQMAGTLAVIHAEHMGKAMSEENWIRFSTLRDDKIPALRKKLKAELAQSRQPSPAQAEPTDVSDAELAAATRAYNVYDDGEQPMAMHAALTTLLCSRRATGRAGS